MKDSFIEKLKKGMGAEQEIEEEKKEERKSEIKETAIEFETEKKERVEVKKPPVEDKPPSVKAPEAKLAPAKAAENKPSSVKTTEGKEKWPKPEGQLAIDVYQTESELVIQSAIAGIKAEDLEITIEGDVATIKGERQKPIEEKGDYFYQECYWGPFSRQIILPVEVDPNRVEATLKEGILTIRVPKILRDKKRKIMVKE